MASRKTGKEPPPGGANDVQGDPEIGPEGRLTCIYQGIHCVATPDTTGGEDELYQIQIDNFLNTLAEVALAVARRREQLES